MQAAALLWLALRWSACQGLLGGRARQPLHGCVQQWGAGGQAESLAG